MHTYRLLLLLVATAGFLSSCICHTSASLMQSSNFSPKSEHTTFTPAIYRVGEQYYLAQTVKYWCRQDKVCIGGVIAVPSSEVKLPFGYEREEREKTFYFLLSPKDVRQFLGIHAKEAPANAPSVIEQDAWNAAVAVQVPAPYARLEIYSDDSDAPSYSYYPYDKRFRLRIPSFYSGDAAVKAPLAVLLLGVDIPVSIALTSTSLITECVAYPIILLTGSGQSAPATEKREE